MIKKIFYILLILVFFDFFTDPILRTYGLSFPIGDRSIKLIITLIFAILFTCSIRSVPKFKADWIPFWLVLIVVYYGTMNGLASNEPVHALNDASSFVALFLVLVVSRLNVDNRQEEIYKILKFSVFILFLKVIIYQFVTATLIGTPTWKLLLKQSPMLLIPFSVYFAEILTDNKRHITFSICVFILLIAMARMIFLSLIFIAIVQIVRYRKSASFTKILAVFFSISASFYLYLYTQQVDQQSIFSHIYGGEVYQSGLDYRVVQLGVIVDRYLNDGFWGVGMGYVTPGYLTYEDLPKPYLLELDLLNFFSKVGLPLSAIYLFSYFLLYRLILKVSNEKTRALFISLFIGMLSLLLYSVGQTLHQSYLYWIFYGMLYGYLILEIKSQRAHAQKNL